MDKLPATETIIRLLRQQSALAGFGSFAFQEDDLYKILNEASRLCAECLGVPFGIVYEYREETNDLLAVAGCGWNAGVVGQASRADTTSPSGRAFVTGQPVNSALVSEADFALLPFHAEHGVVSAIDVIIKGDAQPFGILEIDSATQLDFDKQDVDFLIGFADVLAVAVGTSKRTNILRATIARMTGLLEDKSRRLEEKSVSAAEMHHRVRNSLHLIYGMLTKQLEDFDAANVEEGIRGVARRVMSLAQVYDHLLGTEMSRTIQFGDYLTSLCVDLAELPGDEKANIELVCRAEPVVLGLDAATTLGVVVAEVVSNSYGHAFPNGTGTITVDLRRSDQDGEATLTISDDGVGFADTGTSKRHGLGLVRRLVRQVGGHIELRSDQGTTWTIRFPVTENQAPQPITSP